MKTHKGASKRAKITAKGRVKVKSNYSGHLMSGKSGSRCRRLRKKIVLSPALGRAMKRALGA